jgi:hypothetical protein
MTLSVPNNTYQVTIHGPREKVALIKLIRNIHPNGGLKGAKDTVEDALSFEAWMAEVITFDILLDDAQLGRLWYHTQNDDRFSVSWMMRVNKPKIDIDLTA